ncbi:MAG: glycosyltransferase family 4 protein [Magnetospirillum sp.]|nr:glycosyltransferase family 4 protein [Magnetospirillum sp.]
MRARRLGLLVGQDWSFLSHRLGLARAARDAGYDVTVITPLGGSAQAIRNHGFRLKHVPFGRNLGTPATDLLAIGRLARLCHELELDVLHNFALKPALIGGLGGLLAGVPAVVSTVAGLGYMFINHNLKTRALRLAVTSGLRATMGRAGCRLIVQNRDDQALVTDAVVAAERVRLVRGSGVDARQFAPTPEPEGIPVAVLPARMLWDKGVGELVEAARRLHAAGTPIRIALVGGPDAGNPRSVGEDQLRAWHDEGIVEYWGHSGDMPGVWARAHIAVLPSYREGLPKALLEAAACGRPLVTTDVPGCRELVEHGANGLLVPVRESAGLAEALARLAASPEERLRLGAEARRRVEAELGDSAIQAAILAVYDEALAGGRQR